MTTRPVIFISATSDLRSARDLVGKVLYSMGYEPVWQEIAATDGGELLDVLRRRIAPGATLVQLVGRRYGAEPPHATAAFGRVSYTQFEALEAERLGTKVIYHFVDESFPTDPAGLEPPEMTSLQAAYRQRLIDTNRLRQDRIANAGDLELSIRRISDELAALRRQADRRHRNMLRLGIAAVAGVVLVAVLVFVASTLLHKRQTEIHEQTAKIDEKLEKLIAYTQQLRPLADPKPVAQRQVQPESFPPAVIEKAKFLTEFGNAEQQALGYIFLKRHAEADRIIQGLKSQPGNPIDEAFRLLTMEGNNWYQAGDPDKAIGP